MLEKTDWSNFYEAFGTAGKGSPASRVFTSPARKSAKGAISSPILAFCELPVELTGAARMKAESG
jgi:hypothetical protein